MKLSCYLCNRETKPLFGFPKDQHRLKQWLDIIGHKRLKKLTPVKLHASYRLCAKHFAEQDFTSTLRTRLTKYALPKIGPIIEEGEKSKPARRASPVITDGPPFGNEVEVQDSSCETPDSPGKAAAQPTSDLHITLCRTSLEPTEV